MSKKHRHNTSLARVQQEKANPNYTVVMNGPSALPVMMPRNMKAYLNEGYRNKTAFRVVGQIARSGAGIKWKHYSDETKQREVKNSDLLKLWNRPNSEQGGTKFRENMLGYYCLTGNSYVLGINASQNPNAKFDEMYCLRPDLMQVHINNQEVIDYYQFGPAYPYKPYAKPFVMHSKLFAANDDVYGLSPIEVAAMLIDVQKASQKWNLSLMSNMAAPSGAWVTKQILNDPDYRNLKREIHEKFSGPRNAREPVILHGGVEWQSMSMTPMELDFLASDDKTDRDIAGIFFNFPTFLLGLADATFANQSEAKHYLYTDIIFPIWDMFVDDINSWLTPRYGGYLDYDREDVETIQERIQAAKAQASDRAMAEWAAGTTTFHEARDIQGKVLLPNKDFIMLNGTPIFVDQIDDFVQASMDKVINPPPPPPQLMLPHPGNTTVTEEPPDNEDEQESDDPGDNEDNAKTLARAPLARLSPLALPRYIRTQRTKALDLHTKEQKQAYINSMEATRDKWIEQIQPRIADYFKDEQKTVIAAIKRSDDAGTADERVTHALNVVEQQGTLKQVLVKIYQDVGSDVGDQVLKELKAVDGAPEHKGAIADFINFFAPDVLVYLLSMCAMKVQQISTRTVAQIRLELTDGVAQGESIPELAKRIDSLYLEQIIPNRSTVIARTEVIGASNYGSNEAASQSGLTLNKVWLATEDSRTRPDHANADGQEVPMDQPFNVGGSQLMFPGDSSLGATADEIIQCRCTQYYKRVEDASSDDTQDENEDTGKSLKTYVLSLPETTISREQYRELLKAKS